MEIGSYELKDQGFDLKFDNVFVKSIQKQKR